MNIFFTYRLRHTSMLCYVALLSCALLSCKKLIEVQAPVTSINAANVYASDVTATSVLTGLYTGISQNANFSGVSGISILTALSADELTLYNGVTNVTLMGYYKNAFAATVASSIGAECWVPVYNYIFTCNAAIEGLNASTTLTPVVKQQLLGEAKFMRAFFYFYLANFFGDVPLPITTNYLINAALTRAGTPQIYQQIATDLIEAHTLLSEAYLNENLQAYSGLPERVRPTKWAAAALLARVYLYMGKYQDAEKLSTEVIGHTALYSLPPLNDAFLKNSTEAIWQLQPVLLGHNTEDAWVLILPPTGPSYGTGFQDYPVYLSDQLLSSFEAGDKRKTNWIGQSTIDSITFYYYPYKYKSATLDAPVTEYLMVLRLGEQYLIRAEARAQTGNITGAAADLNAIRVRAGVSNTTADTHATLLTAIQHERQVELFTEWGHRWLDMKRTNTLDAIMTAVTPQKGGTWEPTDKLHPLPLTELQRAPTLVQNPGY